MRNFKAALGALAFLAFALSFAGPISGVTVAAATALPSPLPACGTAFYTPTPGAPIISAPMAAQLNHSELCAVQPSNTLTAYGLICDGVADNSGLLPGLPFPLFIPYGAVCFVNESLSSLPDGRFFGNSGHLQTVESGTPLPRAPNWATIATPPAGWTPTNADSITTAFNGDFSHNHLTWGTKIQGTATLQQPTTGYVIYPTTAGIYGVLTNTSGWNNATNSNSGRTDTAGYYTDVINNGQGDATAYHCNSTVGGGGKADATSFLAEPNAGCIGGNIQTNLNGGYLNPLEFLLDDNGHDAAASGLVVRLKRTVNTAALGAIWQGIGIQSDEGTKASDVAINVSGEFTEGIDLTNINYQSPAPGTAALAFNANACIYPNAVNNGGPNGERYARYTNVGNTSICYNASDSAIEDTVGGIAVDEICNQGVILLLASGGVASNYLEFIDGSATPDKFIVATGGALTVLNNATSNVWQVSDAGTTAQAGQAKAAALSNSTTTEGVLPPLYTAAGASVTATFHGSTFSCTFSASTTCDLGASYWTGAAVFATAPQGCLIGNQGGTGINFTVFATSSATAKFFASASNSATITGFCFGA